MIFKAGERFEEVFIVSTDIYEGFIQNFKDRNPLHIDEAFAIEKGFKGRVMHGSILTGFLSYFIGECLPTKDIMILSHEIQFKNAVYLNDKLRFTAEIVGVYDSVDVVEFKFNFKNSGNIVVAKGKIQTGLLK